MLSSAVGAASVALMLWAPSAALFAPVVAACEVSTGERSPLPAAAAWVCAVGVLGGGLPLAAALSMALIAAIEKAVPDAYEKVAIAAVQLVLALLAVFGVGTTLAAMGALPSLLAP